MSQPSGSGFSAILELLQERSGLVLRSDDHGPARTLVKRLLNALGLVDENAYLDRLGRDDSALDSLIAGLVVGETYFFREHRHFEFITGTIIPEIAEHRGERHLLRAWSAGCASGEEAYSLAMLYEMTKLPSEVRIRATDISRPALEKARAARYRKWSLRGEAAAWARPFLERRGEEFEVRPAVRRRVTFSQNNLASSSYPSFTSGLWAMDLILCRNVLIYFGRDTIAQVAKQLHESLAEGGWLITGSADPPLMRYAPFETVLDERGVFYRRPRVSALARVAIGRKTPALGTPAPPPAASDERRAERPVQRQSARRSGERATKRSAPAKKRPAPAKGAKTDNAAKPEDSLAVAQRAMKAGDYRRAATLARAQADRPDVLSLGVRALANVDLSEAERYCREALHKHPLSAQLNHLLALLLLSLRRLDEAEATGRRVVYLNPEMAQGHFSLGTILVQRGDYEGARLSYRNAANLTEGLDPDEIVPLSDGDRAGTLRRAALDEIDKLNDRLGTSS